MLKTYSCLFLSTVYFLKTPPRAAKTRGLGKQNFLRTQSIKKCKFPNPKNWAVKYVI